MTKTLVPSDDRRWWQPTKADTGLSKFAIVTLVCDLL